MAITSLTCSLSKKMVAILVMITMASSAPRPSSDFLSSLRSSSDQLSGGQLAMGRDWGLSMGDKEGRGDGGALQQILRRHSNSPSIRFLLKDHLFLRHLQLFLDHPDDHHFHLLRNRAKTLRRRKTQEISSHFFLRN